MQIEDRKLMALDYLDISLLYMFPQTLKKWQKAVFRSCSDLSLVEFIFASNKPSGP